MLNNNNRIHKIFLS